MSLNLAMLSVSAILGACIGSFLNVVIYRMPRGLSISNPRRSFCPRCGHTIAGYDNIPVVSYLLLRGRCRHCRTAISVQYPLVELVTALLFAATYDVFIVHQWRAGVSAWPRDGAIIVAHWALWAGLLATAAMDIEAYHLDVRVTWAVTAIGILCNTLWTPESSAGWIRPAPATAAGTLAATLALAVTALYTLGRARHVEPDGDEALADETASEIVDRPA
ncbi:MAG: prepilin peptidase, partial [Phycisphaerae bacterium]